MANCKDCVHYEACQSQVPRTFWDSESFYKDCEHFKDKSRFVELPCKVGDTVYVIYDDNVRQAVIVAFYIDKVGIICELKISINGEKPTAPCCVSIIDKDSYTDDDIYLTKAEAEKALKEREQE